MNRRKKVSKKTIPIVIQTWVSEDDLEKIPILGSSIYLDPLSLGKCESYTSKIIKDAFKYQITLFPSTLRPHSKPTNSPETYMNWNNCADILIRKIGKKH